MGGGEEPQTTALQKLSQTIDQYTLLLWKVFYNTADQAQGGGLDNVLCREQDIMFGSSTVSIKRTDVAAIVRSGMHHSSSLSPSPCLFQLYRILCFLSRFL